MSGCSLLLGDSESFSGSSGRLGVLTSDLKVPEVTKTSVLAHLLHTLQIFSESSIDNVGDDLRVSSVLNAPLSVQEPQWNSVV